MKTISGIPAHPLFVHIPAVLLPLAAIGVIAMVIRPSWYRAYRWPVLVITALGAIGAYLSVNAGEELEETLIRAGEPNTWGEHAERGETAEVVAFIFLALVAAYVIIPWILERRQRRAGDAGPAGTPPHRVGPTWLAPVLAVLVVIGAVASVATVVRAGHSGAKSVWVEQPADGG